MIVTMSTIGYGDVIPITPIEVIYVIVISLISCGMFGYSMNTIGQILSEKAQKIA